ncbi:MAG: hypothetical protein AB8B74_15235 [Crocinitomicaceae bacterium]
MKKSKQWFSVLLFCLSFMLFSFTLNPSNTDQRIERHIIVFKINTVSTYEESAKIDTYLQTKDGILASRTNFDNSTYFCYSLKEKNLSQSDFDKWFAELGYSISCFDKVVEGEGVSITNNELENCSK